MRSFLILSVYLSLLLTNDLFAQNFTRLDSLRGSITPERAWWNLQHYDLDVTVFPEQKSLVGTNTISYRIAPQQYDELSTNQSLGINHKIMQIDLQAPMTIDSVVQNGQRLSYQHQGPVYWITTNQNHQQDTEYSLTCYFSGAPVEAQNPPWDGGFTWNNDELGRPFIANANQGIGASVWWPNKDHPYDEPDRGIDLHITLPKPLVGVGNGRLIAREDINQTTHRFHWRVGSPINNYGVNVNIGHYVQFSEQYPGINGDLDCSYWVLDYNLEQAQNQFKQVPKMLEAFEYWFGPYPFYEDGYQLVEVPYLGMEHQSSVTYGNGYRNGYRGTDLSGSGWGMKFDFIIIHESGHEWFANNITNKDVADMWIHEGFTAYSENLFLDYHFGSQASSAYVTGTKKRILNDRPLIGAYNVNNEGSGDMYYKGANLLHTLRQLIDDDQKWRQILVGLNEQFKHQTVTSKQIEDYIGKASGLDLRAFWEQYLHHKNLPVLTYKINQNELEYKYTDVIDGFSMPLRIKINENLIWLTPSSRWNTYTTNAPINEVTLDDNFLVLQASEQ